MIKSMLRSEITDNRWYKSMLAGNPGEGSAYELIETAIVSGVSTTEINFSGLNAYASTYKHLQIRAVVRSGTGNVNIRINGDSGANYTAHQLYGGGTSGTTVISQRLGDTTFFLSAFSVSSGEVANAFASSIIDILDPYAAKNKTVRTFTGMVQTAPNSYILIRSGLHISTEQLTSISLFVSTGTYVAGSRFSIYGIKG
jgi:hypothetical protein